MNRTIDYLVSQGFNKALITGDYRGEKEPDIFCDSCTEDEFTKNRRTVVKVIQ
jgi:outer membrane protein OmpA-like peptidoglycan-associated protein